MKIRFSILTLLLLSATGSIATTVNWTNTIYPNGGLADGDNVNFYGTNATYLVLTNNRLTFRFMSVEPIGKFQAPAWPTGHGAIEWDAKTNVTIIGKGDATKPDIACTANGDGLTYTNNCAALAIGYSSPSHFATVSNVVVDNLDVRRDSDTSDRQGSTGFETTGSELRIINCRVRHAFTGISLTWGSQNFSNIYVIGNYVTNCCHSMNLSAGVNIDAPLTNTLSHSFFLVSNTLCGQHNWALPGSGQMHPDGFYAYLNSSANAPYQIISNVVFAYNKVGPGLKSASVDCGGGGDNCIGTSGFFTTWYGAGSTKTALKWKIYNNIFDSGTTNDLWSNGIAVTGNLWDSLFAFNTLIGYTNSSGSPYYIISGNGKGLGLAGYGNCTNYGNLYYRVGIPLTIYNGSLTSVTNVDANFRSDYNVYADTVAPNVSGPFYTYDGFKSWTDWTNTAWIAGVRFDVHSSTNQLVMYANYAIASNGLGVAFAPDNFGITNDFYSQARNAGYQDVGAVISGGAPVELPSGGSGKQYLRLSK